MAVAVESPFVLNISQAPIEIPQHGTFVAGRRRRINNDPYGGDGYVWEDITNPSNIEEDRSAQYVQDSDNDVQKQSCLTESSSAPERQSVATQRLVQLKEHMIDILPPKRAVDGFSLDNIHFGMGGLQDWQPPPLNCPQYPPNCRTNLHLNQEWQDYARNVLFRPQEQQLQWIESSKQSNDIFSQWDEASHRGTEVKDTPQTKAQSARKRDDDISFESLDVTCSSWSSLMAHRRRQIAEIA